MTLGDYLTALSRLPEPYKDLAYDRVQILLVGEKILIAHPSMQVMIYQRGGWYYLSTGEIKQERAND